jgi:hypothetical protein
MDGGDPGLRRRWQLSHHVVQGLSVDPVADPESDDVEFHPDDPGSRGPKCLDDEPTLLNIGVSVRLIDGIFSFRGDSDLDL